MADAAAERLWAEMGKQIKKDPIGSHELVDYLNTSSDFDFELRTLKMLRQYGLQCSHSGHYEDPVTKKSRQFDLRAIKTSSTQAYTNRIRLAVECKNIGDNFPVLVLCTPRHDSESFHDVVVVTDPKLSSGDIPAFHSRARAYRMRLEHSIYKPGSMVGKSTVQVGRSIDGGFTSNDSEVFEKWSQCLSSATDLVDDIYWDGKNEKNARFLSTVIPIVVIPDGRLWVVEYSDDGNRCSDPIQSDRCPCFVGKEYEVGNKMASTWMSISHIEIMTFSGLESFVSAQLCSDMGPSAFFPIEGIVEAMHSKFKDAETT